MCKYCICCDKLCKSSSSENLKVWRKVICNKAITWFCHSCILSFHHYENGFTTHLLKCTPISVTSVLVLCVNNFAAEFSHFISRGNWLCNPWNRGPTGNRVEKQKRGGRNCNHWSMSNPFPLSLFHSMPESDLSINFCAFLPFNNAP